MKRLLKSAARGAAKIVGGAARVLAAIAREPPQTSEVEVILRYRVVRPVSRGAVKGKNLDGGAPRLRLVRGTAADP